MKPLATALAALVLGAGAMYYLDPEQGRRRRALVADRLDSVSHDTAHYLEGRRKRTGDRVRGLLATVRNRFGSGPPGDEQLNGQIRSRLGRTVSYPHAIETEAKDGRVVLRGAVLADEFNAAMAEIWSIRGVVTIDSRLSLHAEPGNVPGLQGKPHRTRRARLRRLARNAANLLALAAGIGAGVGALRSPGKHTGMYSLALALLGYSLGDGARQVARRRRVRLIRRESAERMATPAEAPPERVAAPAAGEAGSPPAWH